MLPPVALVESTLEVRLPLLYFLLVKRGLADVDVEVEVAFWKGDFDDACRTPVIDCCRGVELRARKFWFVVGVDVFCC